MRYPCDKCGICCRHIDQIPQLKDFDSGDGKCIHLLDDNLCSIYDSRPDVCNVEKMYALKYKYYFTEEEYISKNVEGCNMLKRKYGFNKS